MMVIQERIMKRFVYTVIAVRAIADYIYGNFGDVGIPRCM